MSSFTQVKLVLTSNEDVLSTLRRNSSMRKDKYQNNDEYWSHQFNGREFRFYHNKPIVVPQEIGDHLYRSSGVLIGDAINGEMQAGIIKIEEWELGQSVSKTACPQCGKDQGSKAELIKHLQSCGEEAAPASPAPKVVQVGKKV